MKKDRSLYIRQIRERLGMNQYEFADLVESRQPHINQYELGRIPLGLKSFINMVQKAGGSVEVIAKHDGVKTSIKLD